MTALRGDSVRGGFRRRLMLAFVLAVGLSAALLAVASYFLVRHQRMEVAVERAVRQTRFNLELGQRFLPPEPSSGDLSELFSLYERRGSFETLILSGEGVGATSSEIDQSLVPDGMEAEIPESGVAHARTRLGEEPFLVTAGRPLESPITLYFFFPQQRLFAELSTLRTALLTGWAAVVGLAGLVGRTFARTTLRPVAEAAHAARSVADGLLGTRLRVESVDEFGTWAASFNRMAEALEQKISSLTEAKERERRFTSDVAHELRTPLGSLVSEASLLVDHLHELTPEGRRVAELMITDADRLGGLVGELIEISRLDAGQEAVHLEPVPLEALVSSIVAARGWGDRVEVKSQPVTVHTDPRRLERVLANLVENALEHGGSGVGVRVGREDTKALLEVSDQGAGIASDHLPHVFDRFYKADPARAGGGSGLGLAIASENVSLLGGTIEAESQPGQGSRFIARIPL